MKGQTSAATDGLDRHLLGNHKLLTIQGHKKTLKYLLSVYSFVS